ncbi:hypothetical protein AAHA92_17994 [Salvia divinorum]|uniref:Uncharacterized protein n=1 Tax=Salvia divinorum TaxID=28513 RepID=A0ABD1H0M9_SALDI
MDDDNKKWSARKPPLPVDRLRSNDRAVNLMMKSFLLEIERVRKVKGKWCHNFTKALFQFVSIKLQSRNKKPDTSLVNLSTLHVTARCLVAVVQIVLKVGGKWSNEYNEDLVQFAIGKPRSSSAPSISNSNNPLVVAVGTANKLSNSCSSSYNIHRYY